ncbi:hypothetical protein DFO55_11375 [Grimontella sp. AG753]|uniref:Uncharacterized protein n=1 Tax=Phytobacter diazotrophicus TaxID=395631 RepID=A0ABM7VNE9_9ENTR|nr:hypothetical protein DFO55_11375 [Grimontella sp. AG753]TCW44363.1 hypothetical protein EDC53_112123 [Phytobacter diazotrophicus]BDD48541.1 hypothetical protein PDTA9734_00280 [Phytobacter diazotrophicus]BEG79573.1 hypothetical protein PDTA9730_00290 [Phytobacter diazotrophicus]BEG85373.1 hypothetical protein PDTA9759_00290 [Phytobacter diazotrophicus]
MILPTTVYEGTAMIRAHIKSWLKRVVPSVP